MTTRTRFSLSLAGATTAAALATMAITMAAPPAQDARKPVPVVAVTVLEPLLPTLDGWTRGQARTDRVVVSETCSYAFADALYSHGDGKVRVTLADTGFGPDSLITLATMVVTLPDDYTGDVPPAAKVARVLFKGSPAATLWDNAKGEGEFTVVVGGRFVAKAEGSHVDALEILRTFIDQIDLKRLGDLK
ncbi:MAG TPA: hypothetical protein VLT86_08800 [Vicinamibacterales bacterium]|nr:hypothetical protein [Vicinamibacterales bacterium]